ncbi:exosporium leader peptide-containing protein [Bacillus paramycoides]
MSPDLVGPTFPPVPTGMTWISFIRNY